MCKVSVIIPNYNHKLFLKQRIESVLSQTKQDFEIILLDDCSTDGSQEIFDQYRSHAKVSAVIYNKENSGSTFLQWEKGISMAKGNYIWIAESDDYSDPFFLEIAISRLEKDQSDLFYCKSIQVDENNAVLNHLEWWLDDLDPGKWKNDYTNPAAVELNKFLIYKNYIANASSVVFRNNGKLINYLATIKKYRYCGDWLFWLQYFKDAGTISFSIKTINYWRAHLQTTRAAPTFSKNIELLAIYRWIAGNVLLSENASLLNYYFHLHLIKLSRRNLSWQLNLLIQGSRYTRLFPGLFMKYFFNKKN